MGRVTIFTIHGCPFCTKAKSLLANKGVYPTEINIQEYPDRRKDMLSAAKLTSVPQIFFNDKYIGGSAELQALEDGGQLDAQLIQTLSSPDPSDVRLRLPTGAPVADVHLAAGDDTFTIVSSNGLPQRVTAAQVLKEMTDPKNGVDIRDRRYHLRTYKSCFIGSAFVTWLVQRFSLPSRADAIQLGRQLEDIGFFSHVCGDHRLKDEELFYRLAGTAVDAVLNAGGADSPRPLGDNPCGVVSSALKKLRKILSAHIDSEGKTDYIAAGEDGAYIQWATFAATSFRGLDLSRLNTDEAKKAFWINTYNLMVKHGYVAVGVPGSTVKRLHFFGNVAYEIGKYKLTLNDIEHGVLRCNRRAPGSIFRPFGSSDPRNALCVEKFDPRIHFALNCGAKSCPPVNAYTIEAVDEELKLATMSFLEAEDNFSLTVDASGATLHTSMILVWYLGDFGGLDGLVSSILSNKWMQGPVPKQLESLTGKKIKQKGNHYNWDAGASRALVY